MSSILEELYYGNIRPDSRVYAPDSLFVESAKLKQKNLDNLMTTLNEQEKETFEKYCDAVDEMESISKFDIFSYALKFGILLMAEIFIGKSEITGCES